MQPTTVAGATTIAKPYVTYTLIVINLLVFAYQYSVGINAVAERWGMWPVGIVTGDEWYRLLTSAFLHGSFLHIAFNMYVLFALGPTLERILGHVRFTALYLLSALGGGVVSYFFSDITTVSVGASGAIFGLMGALVVAGRRLLPGDIGMVASLGIGELPVLRRPRVAFFSNGDELRSIGQPLELGDVYDSNRYTLNGMLRRAGMAFNDLGVVRDDREQIKKTFLKAADMADVVITSAGASVGDADYVKDVLDEIGEVNFWKIAMKPGRPLSFGKIGDSLFFGLPGNPVSVMVTFYQFVLPALRRLSGEASWQPLRLQARTLDRLKKQRGRTEFQRGVLSQDETGALVVSTTGEQGSGILSSMSQANCFVILPIDSAGAQLGEVVEVEPFLGLV